MNLTEHFTVHEFVRSHEAKRRRIDNSLPATLLPAAQRTLELLERIRTTLCHLAGRPVPIFISSGYRCLALNRAIGSHDTSDHVNAAAADFEAPAFGDAFQIATTLASRVDELQIGQLIYEFGRDGWVHVSTREPERPINRVITINHGGKFVGVVQG